MSVLFCDSNEELFYDKVEALNLKVIYMPYTIDDTEHIFDLGKTMDFINFYQLVKLGHMPSTQALNPQNYVDYFEPYLKEGQDILYIHFSNKLSGTFEFMQKAIQELKAKYPERSIRTVDTLAISIGSAGLLYESAMLHNRGASDDEVIKFVENNRNHYAAYFVVDDLYHLKRGGRLSSTKAFMGSLMNVKPILGINAIGSIVVVDKAKGKLKALLNLIERLKTEGENVLDHPIYIVHANAKEEANFLLEKVKEYLGKDANITMQEIGPTIGTHCGPGTIGMSFYCKKRIIE